MLNSFHKCVFVMKNGCLKKEILISRFLTRIELDLRVISFPVSSGTYGIAIRGSRQGRDNLRN